MTVSYSLSMKLHEKYPEMGEDSYWVWGTEDHSVTGATIRVVLPRDEAYEEQIECPALSLGELVRELGAFKMELEHWDSDDDYEVSYEEVISEDGDTQYNLGAAKSPEDALAQAILEGEFPREKERVE